jgi:hypothetical protein
MPGLAVRRDFSAGNRLPEESRTTYLHLAASSHDWHSLPQDLMQEIESFVSRGGRLVVTLLPETRPPLAFIPRPVTTGTSTNKPSKTAKSPGPAKAGKKKGAPDIDELLHQVSLKTKWGLEFGFLPLPQAAAGAHKPAPAVNRSDLPLPETLDWHSATVFTNLDKAWQTIYARGTNPVVIERRFGTGAVVMATDSYFLSNEALRKDRHADLLAWLVGPAKQVVFDESHFGIVEEPGVSTLIRKYHLYGLAAGLILLAGLFIWKNALSFVPPYPPEEGADYVAGKDAAAGFVNLLRRNVPARDLLNLCFAEWTKSLTRGNAHLIARVDQAQTVLEAENARPQRDRNPVKTYQEISRILKGTRH